MQRPHRMHLLSHRCDLGRVRRAQWIGEDQADVDVAHERIEATVSQTPERIDRNDAIGERLAVGGHGIGEHDFALLGTVKAHGAGEQRGRRRMAIETIFAHVSCSDLETSARWYEQLFGKPPLRRPMPGLAEWQFSDSAEVQLFESPEDAGHSTLTLGVLPLEPERRRLEEAGLEPGPIEETDGYFIMRIRDPDQNLVVFASAERC
jgi:hypothetical protein